MVKHIHSVSIAFLLLMCCSLTYADAVSRAYRLIESESTVTAVGGIAGRTDVYPLRGEFVLTVDLEEMTAAFSDVAIYVGSNTHPGNFFYMEDLSPRSVGPNWLWFERSNQQTRTTLYATLDGDLLYLDGVNKDLFPDGYTSTVDAVAAEIPEPATLTLLSLGLVILRQRR